MSCYQSRFTPLWRVPSTQAARYGCHWKLREGGLHPAHHEDCLAIGGVDAGDKLSAVVALHSPSTGIIDSHGFMQAMIGQAEDCGAVFAYRSPFISAETDRELTVHVGGQ